MSKFLKIGYLRLIAYAGIQCSDEPAQTRSLARAFFCPDILCKNVGEGRSQDLEFMMWPNITYSNTRKSKIHVYKKKS